MSENNNKGKKTSKSKINPETGLTAKEELFCMHYVKLLNNGRAAYQAINPKCKDNSAMTKAWQLLRRVEIQAYIDKLKEDLKKSTKISLEQLITAQQDVYADCSKQIDILDFNGNATGRTKMADAKAANDALKNVGKWLGFESTNQNVNVSADESTKEYYAKLSEQLKSRQVDGADEDD